ncbi:hypothetical protein BaRGS_00022499 [Batillaria attramentaria]|uniref:Uncharacterized protein n=1 Tax=Batillaria attramentaria TaxID=370345 RepID=A0ABD0KG49_9CAEN
MAQTLGKELSQSTILSLNTRAKAIKVAANSCSARLYLTLSPAAALVFKITHSSATRQHAHDNARALHVHIKYHGTRPHTQMTQEKWHGRRFRVIDYKDRQSARQASQKRTVPFLHSTLVCGGEMPWSALMRENGLPALRQMFRFATSTINVDPSKTRMKGSWLFLQTNTAFCRVMSIFTTFSLYAEAAVDRL